jgi:hypothetical protein
LLENWAKQMHILFDVHKRNPNEFVSLVKWMLKRGDSGFLQSASFFTKDSGKNYDTFLGIMEGEKLKAKKSENTGENITFKPKTK